MLTSQTENRAAPKRMYPKYSGVLSYTESCICYRGAPGGRWWWGWWPGWGPPPAWTWPSPAPCPSWSQIDRTWCKYGCCEWRHCIVKMMWPPGVFAGDPVQVGAWPLVLCLWPLEVGHQTPEHTHGLPWPWPWGHWRTADTGLRVKPEAAVPAHLGVAGDGAPDRWHFVLTFQCLLITNKEPGSRVKVLFCNAHGISLDRGQSCFLWKVCWFILTSSMLR